MLKLSLISSSALFAITLLGVLESKQKVGVNEGEGFGSGLKIGMELQSMTFFGIDGDGVVVVKKL